MVKSLRRVSPVGRSQAGVVSPGSVAWSVVTAGESSPVVLSEVLVESGAAQEIYEKLELVAFATAHEFNELTD